MSLKKHLISTLIYALTILFIAFVFSGTLVGSFRDTIDKGLLDRVEYVTDKSEEILKIDGVESKLYPSYNEAIYLGNVETVLFAKNGLAFKKRTPMGIQSYIIDYSWLKGKEFNPERVKEYVNDNEPLMLIRSVYLTEFTYPIIILFMLLLYVSILVMDSLIPIIATIFSAFKHRGFKTEMFDLTKSLLVSKITHKYKKSWDIPIVLGIYTYFLKDFYLTISDSSILTSILGLIPSFLGILLLMSIYYAFSVSISIDENKIDKM